MEFLPVAAGTSDPLIRNADRNSVEAERITRTFEIYNGIFDSAPIGMWLLGQDPRNHLGRIIRFKELAESYIQPQSTKYTFNLDAQTLVTSTGTQIFNLHVHSKEISYFNSRRGRKIAARVKDSINPTKTSTFNFKSFFALSRDFFNRNGILGVIRKIRSFLTTSP